MWRGMPWVLIENPASSGPLYYYTTVLSVPNSTALIHSGLLPVSHHISLFTAGRHYCRVPLSCLSHVRSAATLPRLTHIPCAVRLRVAHLAALRRYSQAGAPVRVMPLGFATGSPHTPTPAFIGHGSSTPTPCYGRLGRLETSAESHPLSSHLSTPPLPYTCRAPAPPLRPTSLSPSTHTCQPQPLPSHLFSTPAPLFRRESFGAQSASGEDLTRSCRRQLWCSQMCEVESVSVLSADSKTLPAGDRHHNNPASPLPPPPRHRR
ncbi:hypothetical protein O3P69_003266 [Scylla paramamosain]|uniref:Uncharacterized protein n=1 Tax=Scylla paramamosain TaxID=85552 RepID=A0AAW0UKU3_SCYPA